MNEFFRRIGYLLNRRRLDRELASDMEFHREMAARDGGMPLGNALRLREEARDAWGWTWIERLSQDLHYAARMLRRSPGFTMAAVLMLAIGIGVNVAAFGFFDLIVLKPLPVRDPGTLLRFKRRSPQSYASNLPYPEMAFFRDYSKTLSAVMGLIDGKLAIEGEGKPLTAHFVTANYFSELGVAPGLGRFLDPARDAAPDAEPVVVLSPGFWKSHFGADPLVIGKTIRLNNKPATVIGVATDEFGGLRVDSPDLWLPITQQPHFVAGSRLFTDFSVDSIGVTTWGRLRPGLTPRVAEDELRVLAADLRQKYPSGPASSGIWEKESLPSEPGAWLNSNFGSHHGTGTPEPNEFYSVIALVAALSVLILAVACGNLGSLLLATGVSREREISIRVAVGAGRVRLVRQLLTESLLLALLGSFAGLGLGYVVLRSLLALSNTPAWLNPAPDWRVMAFSIGMGFVAAILFGLTPALQVARQRYRAAILRHFLIGAQVAASCILLIVAGLLVRAVDHSLSTLPGFEYEHVVTIDPALGGHGYTPARAQAYLDSMESRLRGLPGVESVARASVAPLGNKKVTAGVNVDGRGIEVSPTSIDPEFFQTMTIPLLRGRNLERGDTRAILVGESLARHAWPGQDPLGKQLEFGDSKYTVIGVAGSARLVALQNPDSVEAYFMAQTADLPSMVLLVKTSGSPEGLVPFMAGIAKTIDPEVFPEIQLMKTSFHKKLRSTENVALVVSLLGSVALLLACLGVVGVVAYAVSQRTKEIGIRMALGAKPSRVLNLVLRLFALPVAAGLLVGLAGAAALSQLLRRELYGISSLDPIAYLAAIALFVVTVTFASLVPARRALRVDPMLALRHQ